MAAEILCTLGPASMNDRTIYRLEELGVSLFRINLSHISLDELASIIDYVQSRTRVPLCLDTEGAQIRTGPLSAGPIKARDNEILRAYSTPVIGDGRSFNFYPNIVVNSLAVGDLISIDFQAVLTQVIDLEPGCAVLRVLNGGEFSANKAVTVDRRINLSPLTEKDRAALELSRTHNINTVALSFANRGTDIDQIRAAACPDAIVIAKIECRNGLANLDAITKKADAILIDRGDLSREVPIEQVPSMQKMITKRAKSHGRKVFVATNLLESMVKAPFPTRAEVNDVFNTLLDGVDGLVLAAETAIGDNPIGCVSMIVKLIREFERDKGQVLEGHTRLGLNAASLLVEPHGGNLVDCRKAAPEPGEIARLQHLNVSVKTLIDCEQIALGTFSPIRGFMDRENLESVLAHHQLADNTVWTMPILLPIQAEDAACLSSAEPVVLMDTDYVPRAMINSPHTYQMDLSELAQCWYNTRSQDHPGVAELLNGSGWFLAGDITLFTRLPSPYRHYELTPEQARYVFTYKGWSRGVGFHTRNVIHRVHEHITLAALEESNADGLLLSPVLGPKKSGDFLSEPIVKSYQAMLEADLLPSDRVVLGSLLTYPRYAGPREAVFTALCRKNMGCSHFIVGRDHAGVGEFYSTEATRELFNQLGDLEVEPVFFEDIGYNLRTRQYEPVSSAENALEMISGTEARSALRNNRPLPEWYMRQLIQDQLRADIAAGKPVFNE